MGCQRTLGFEAHCLTTRGPYPKQDVWGMQLACSTLLRSLDPGRTTTSIQFETVQKQRSCYSNFAHTCHDGMGATFVKDDGTGASVSNSKSNQPWFKRFMWGVHRQMGDVWLPDRAMSQNIPNTMTQVNNPNPKWMYRRFNQGTKWSIQCSIHWSIHSILRIYLTNITTYNSWNYKVLTPEEFTEHFPTKAEEVPPVVGLPTFVSSNVVRQNSHR